MLKKTLLFVLISGLVISCSNGQENSQNLSIKESNSSTSMDYFELSPENAHPRAQELLKEDFFWSPIEETGPFGSDDGSDAFYGFVDWRESNKNASPVTYLKELIIEDWGYPQADWNASDEEKIISSMKGNIDSRLLIGQDNAIIAVGFGQLVLEGKVDKELKDLT